MISARYDDENMTVTSVDTNPTDSLLVLTSAALYTLFDQITSSFDVRAACSAPLPLDAIAADHGTAKSTPRM
jgi:hypothetical protein